MEYGPPAPFEAESWPAGGKIQAAMYGVRLPNIRNCRLQEGYEEIRTESGKVVYRTENGLEITAGDGICLYSGEEGEPDYVIAAIYPYRFLTFEVERI